MCIRFDWINFIVYLGGNVYFLLPSTTKVHTLQRVPPKTRASVTFAWFKWMKFCVFTVFVCGCVRPPGLIAPRRTTIPQRDGIRQPMNEPTKVVSSSSLHSSFKAVTCLILIAEGGDIWQLWFKHMSSSVCVCVCVCECVGSFSACISVCVCVSCEENCCSTGCWWGPLFQVKATDTVQSNSSSPNRFPHTYRGCSHYSPAISAPFLATGNLAFYLPAPLVKIQISRLDETEWGGGWCPCLANVLLPRCCETAGACFTLCYKAGAFSERPTVQCHTDTCRA